MSNKKTCIAIIGAGVAGLVMARHLSSRSEVYEFVVFEQSSQIGGTWIYTDDTEVDKHGLPIHSSMYKNLRFEKTYHIYLSYLFTLLYE